MEQLGQQLAERNTDRHTAEMRAKQVMKQIADYNGTPYGCAYSGVCAVFAARG